LSISVRAKVTSAASRASCGVLPARSASIAAVLAPARSALPVWAATQ
jgi:hypothetical protein